MPAEADVIAAARRLVPQVRALREDMRAEESQSIRNADPADWTWKHVLKRPPLPNASPQPTNVSSISDTPATRALASD